MDIPTSSVKKNLFVSKNYGIPLDDNDSKNIGYYKINKIRVINIYEADYNLFL